MSSVSELRKRKKSLNQIVNPSLAKPTAISQNPANNTSFRPVSSKSKGKKASIANNFASPNSLFPNPNTLRSDIPKSNSRKFPVPPFEKENSAFAQNSASSQTSYYYFPDPQMPLKQQTETPVDPQTTSNTTMTIESHQNTTNKKIPKPSKTMNHLEFSNNSSKTQLITALSSQKLDSKGNSSDCIEVSFSHHNGAEGSELICQENIEMKCEEFNENSFFPGKEEEKRDSMMQEEVSKPEFVHETGFEYSQETLEYLINKEYEYAPHSNYFKSQQKNITPYMRSILLDWMMEVCNEFTLKRETFHLAVNYVDRILTLQNNVPKSELQLIGVVSLFIASKVEEVYPPKVNEFALSADNAFTTDEIRNKEEEVFMLLKFKVNPPTYYMWSNWLMTQWDLYIEHSEYAKNHPLKRKFNQIASYFKQPNEESYVLFREMMQLVDCAILDSESLQYRPRALILSFLYLVLGKNYQQFDETQIVEQMPLCNVNLLNREFIFNDVFANFIFCCLRTELFELLPYIQYCSKFFGLKMNYDLPNATKINKKLVLEGHFEEFLAYQTHNSNNLDFIKKKKTQTN